MTDFTQALGTWFNAGLNFVYPPVCQICRTRRTTVQDGYVCPECWTDVRFVQSPFCERCGLPAEGDITTSFECTNCHEMELHFSTARSAVIAAGLVLEVIHRYKYLNALWFEPFLADLLIRQAKPLLTSGDWDWIVPVPLHHRKERQRQFNQAERLARHLSRATAIPLNCSLVQRVIPTRTQTLLTKAQRMNNVRSAFRMRKKQSLCGARIVLLDDVLTTGATTSECARILLKAGAGEICVWTVARGL